MIQRPPAGTIPDAPGSYQFKDAAGAGDLRRQGQEPAVAAVELLPEPRNLPPRTAQMVATAETVEWIQVRNDVEALMLEYSLIKQHQPRFNIRLKDDKSYPFLAITMSDEWPRAMVMRGSKRKGVRYFGPYGHAYAIRETLDLLLRTFPIRTCSDNKLGRHEKLGKPCLLFHIEKCSGPCVGEIDEGRLRRAGAGAASTSSTATPTPSSSGSRPRCARRPTSSSSSGRPGCATGSTAVRKAIAKQQMVVDKRRGPRRDRHRRRRARGGGRRCSSCAGAGWSGARASSSTRSRT